MRAFITMAGNLAELQTEIWDIEHRIDFESLSKRELERLQKLAVYIPQQLGLEEEDQDSADEDEVDEDPANMRDRFERVFGSLKAMEEHILVSASRTTLVATPLAIYQETSLN